MVKILIAQGETVQVCVSDSDGCFEIAYTETELTITADMPGSHVGGEGLIYREVFAGCTCVPPSVDEKCPTHGKFAAKDLIAIDDAVPVERAT